MFRPEINNLQAHYEQTNLTSFMFRINTYEKLYQVIFRMSRGWTCKGKSFSTVHF